MTKEVKFNSKSILEVKFSKALKGYDALEVDKMLDEVIEDYKAYEENTSKTNDQLAKLSKELETVKAKLRVSELELEKAKAELKAVPKNENVSQDNVSLLKRIDALERALYKKGVNPKKI